MTNDNKPDDHSTYQKEKIWAESRHTNIFIKLAQFEWLSVLGLSQVTNYPLAVRFSVATGYKFTNRLTRSCTDDLLETWSCQNMKKLKKIIVNPRYIWAKMRLLAVFGPLTGPREPVNWHFLPLEVAWGQVPPGGGIEPMVLNKKCFFFTRIRVHEIKNNFYLSLSSDDNIPMDYHHNLSLLSCRQSPCFRFG